MPRTVPAVAAPEDCPAGCGVGLVFQCGAARGGRVRFARCLRCGWATLPLHLLTRATARLPDRPRPS